MIDVEERPASPHTSARWMNWTGVALAILGWLFAAWTTYASGTTARDVRVQDLQTRVTVLESQYQEVTRRLNEIDNKLDVLIDRKAGLSGGN